MVAQNYFALACDSVRHGAILASMRRRMLASIAPCRSNMCACRTDRIAPPIDLSQGYVPGWRETGYGICMGEHLLHFLAWADDMWLFGKTSWN